MTPRRVVYLNHDNPAPSGGVKVIYTHAELLRRNGIDALIVHGKRGFKPDWFQSDVPILYAEGGLALRPDDLVIIPEDFAAALARARSWPVQKVVFCQGHFLVFDGLGEFSSWRDLGISAVLAVSEPVAEFVKRFMGYDNVPVIHNAIDHSLFLPVEKKLQIAFMPRKSPREAGFIRQLFQRLVPHPIPWIEIGGCTESQVAAVLGQSSIFLSLSRHEGFGLPPLEAMACGCLVVGFKGGGGEEYARADNGVWVPDDDLIACAQSLAAAVQQISSPPMQDMISAGRRTALQYTFDRQERDLLATIRHLLGQ